MTGKSDPENAVHAAYETGKARRYNLLFTVNGGAFAILSLTSKQLLAPSDGTQQGLILGDLHLWQLAIGMAVFSVMMTWDIWEFGMKMKMEEKGEDSLFKIPGRVVLVSIGGLLVVGWTLASGIV